MKRLLGKNGTGNMAYDIFVEAAGRVIAYEATRPVMTVEPNIHLQAHEALLKATPGAMLHVDEVVEHKNALRQRLFYRMAEECFIAAEEFAVCHNKREGQSRRQTEFEA